MNDLPLKKNIGVSPSFNSSNTSPPATLLSKEYVSDMNTASSLRHTLMNSFNKLYDIMHRVIEYITHIYYNNPHRSQLTVLCSLKLIISVLALVLVWRCNQHEFILVRLFNTIVCTLFSEVYMVYYGLWHVAMGNKCY